MKYGRAKLLLTIILTLCILLGITACRSPVEMTMGETVLIEGHVELTPRNVIVSKEIFPPASSKKPMGWVVEDDDKTYVAVIVDIKNLRENEITAYDLWSSFSVYMKQENRNGTLIAMVSKDGTVLNTEETIAPDETETVFFILELDDFDLQEKMEAQWGFEHSTDCVLPFDGTTPVAQYKNAAEGDVIAVDGLGTMALKSFAFAEELEPDAPGYTFEYYLPNEKNQKLFVVTTEVKNITKKAQSSYSYLNMMAFADGEVYLADIVADDDHAANIVRGESIDTKKKKRVYGVVSIPKEIKKEDLDVYLYVGGAYYRCTLSGNNE